MPKVTATGDRLDQWKGIADYLGRDVSTVIRWARESGLPVRRIPGDRQRRPVFAYRHEIDAWMLSSELEVNSRHGIGQVRPKLEGPLHSSFATSMEESQTVSVGQVPAVNSGIRTLRRRIAVWVFSAFSVLAGILAVKHGFSMRVFQDGEESFVASYDSPIDGRFIASGGNVYFSAWKAGRVILLTVPEAGGPIREIPVPFVKTHPQAVSIDGKRLLVLAGIGQEREQQLWWVPLDGSNPWRVGAVVCHAADLSPDGHTLAYASGNAIYMIPDTGATPYLLHSFSADFPVALRWSLDGSRILALVDDNAGNAVIWKLSLDKRNPFTLISLAPMTQGDLRFGSLSPVLNGNDDFIFRLSDARSAIRLFENPRWSWLSAPKIETVNETYGDISDLALDRVTSTVFYSRETTRKYELEIFDERAAETRPFLPGISADDVDFSRDGRWITYVANPGSITNTLWIAHVDGSDARQVDIHGLNNLELPRWSPDGTQLAFMARGVGEPFRIFLVSAAGGEPRQASHSTDNQGAPTWSPDGRGLVYGRVLCQEENTCAILRIDVATGSVNMIPGSEGLSTARWSPDGHYIAALRTDTRQLLLFDQRSGKWRILADGVNGNDLAWAPNSSVIYASRPGGTRPAILRIPLSGQVAEALDLSPWAELCGRVDTWFAVMPNGSLVFVRLVTGVEIVAIHYKQR